MAAAGNSSIFRIDANGETEATAKTASQIIEFNGGVAPDALGNLQTTSAHYVRDISIHPNPNRSYNILQDMKAGTKEITIAGWFDSPATVSASSLTLLDTWFANKATNASLKFGRFGLRLNDYTTVSLVPSTTQGYILHDLYVERPEDDPDSVTFVAKLFFNKPTTPS